MFDSEHVHVNPSVPFDTAIRKGKLEIKLTSPLGPGQAVSIHVDELETEDVEGRMFNVWATSDQGLGENKGNDFKEEAKLTLEQYLSRLPKGLHGGTGQKIDR